MKNIANIIRLIGLTTSLVTLSTVAVSALIIVCNKKASNKIAKNLATLSNALHGIEPKESVVYDFTEGSTLNEKA